MTPSDRLCSIVRKTSDAPPAGWQWGGVWFAFEASQTRESAQRKEREFMARFTSCNAEGHNGVGGQPLTDDAAYSMMRRSTRYGIHSFKHGETEVLVTVPTDERPLTDNELDDSIAALAWVKGADAEALKRYVTTGER